ncbi:hypothetical protein PG996_005567 [Apiospora saccharicola]|uniref:RNA-binding protein n=1 Tax=Apiospora saccharicola TaxID=335842 RepID=A0ABR1VLT7_9PEZI
MYDDYDHPARERDERGSGYRRRSPSPRDSQYRSRHDSSRSPRRAPRGDDSYRDRSRDWDRGYEHAAGTTERYDRGHGGYQGGSDAGYGDKGYRRRYSPGNAREGRAVDPGYERERGRRSPREYSSPEPAGDDAYYRDGGYRSGPGRPYHTIKMDDLPENMSSQEVDSIMKGLGASGLVEVRIKSDDRAGDRRCYAFAEFASDEDSVDFLEKNYPALEFTTADGFNAYVPIAYSRERRQPTNPDDWQCTMCHFENFSRRATCKQCKAPRSSENVADMQLDGKSDECPQQTPSQFLVIRNLPPTISENNLAVGVKKLYVAKEDEPKQAAGAPPKLKSTAPVGNTTGLGAKPGSLSRVFMIRDRYNDAGCRYGFAEFSNLDDARAAMAKFNASPQFTIGSKPVTVAYIHSGVFIPYFKPVTDHDRKFTFTASHNPSLLLSYWNPSVYASEFTIFSENLYEEKSNDGPRSEQAASVKDSKKRKADKELTAPSGKKVIAMAPQLAKWANKHAELRGAKNGAKKAGNDEKGPPVTGVNSIGSHSFDPPPPPPPPPSESYADLDRNCCLLCRRKFVSEPSLRRHEQLSDLHKKNLDDKTLVQKAIRDLKAVGKEPTSNYRDRAKERRLVHNQPNKPKPIPSNNLHRKKQPQSSASKENETPKSEPAPNKPAMSKGAGLLAKMGWSAGAGLGAEGAGRTNIIETAAYAPGVGLGAEGGKIGDAVEEAARATKNDYSDFVAKAKDKARERYEKMG